ncbi:3-oxoacyl-reductase [Massariosphaeria phaeospora]|uniref:3-oxoacyl-reductase n=1 Tax=Massariosphaeria phaeospora TaxID=100035 RepID=A0A7C8I728_9PLEO|nr:3-oxoacyl-reductase [Massariosphaeria phaeospora]
MVNVLIVGATGDLGTALVNRYAQTGKKVYATYLNGKPDKDPPKNVEYIPEIDVTQPNAAGTISLKFLDTRIDLLVICTGVFYTETLDALNWENELRMYKVNAMGPLFLIKSLRAFPHLIEDNVTKIVLLSGEVGSIALRADAASGGNYGGHASKAALNMVGKLLSIDMKPKGIPVVLVHTGYLTKTLPDGSKNLCKDHPDSIGAREAAEALYNWIDMELDMTKTGQLWAIRGTAGIRTAAAVLGQVDEPQAPRQLPW